MRDGEQGLLLVQKEMSLGRALDVMLRRRKVEKKVMSAVRGSGANLC